MAAGAYLRHQIPDATPSEPPSSPAASSSSLAKRAHGDGRARVDAAWPHRCREESLAASQVVASIAATKAAGIALGRRKDLHAKLTIDAMVMATAALAEAIVVTGEPSDPNLRTR
jgi:hypothetical protein